MENEWLGQYNRFIADAVANGNGHPLHEEAKVARMKWKEENFTKHYGTHGKAGVVLQPTAPKLTVDYALSNKLGPAEIISARSGPGEPSLYMVLQIGEQQFTKWVRYSMDGPLLVRLRDAARLVAERKGEEMSEQHLVGCYLVVERTAPHFGRFVVQLPAPPEEDA